MVSPRIVRQLQFGTVMWLMLFPRETLVPSTLTTTSTNIDDAQEEAMRDELAGRTGDTDSEDENNIAAA